jgi:hypothetical protein
VDPVETIIQTNSQSRNNGVCNTRMCVCVSVIMTELEERPWSAPTFILWNWDLSMTCHYMINKSEIYFHYFFITNNNSVTCSHHDNSERGYFSESSNALLWQCAVQELEIGKVLLIHFMKLQVLWDVTEWRFPTFRNISGVKTGSVTAILYLGVSIYMRTFHMYWRSLVQFGLGDRQIIPMSSLIVSFMKIGTQKTELHEWVYLKSCHFL